MNVIHITALIDKLTGNSIKYDERIVSINIDKIIAFYSNDNSFISIAASRILLDGGYKYNCKESVEDIEKLIKKAKRFIL